MIKMLKITILTEGGGKKGFGHIVRCIAIYQAFEKKKIKPQLIINGKNIPTQITKGVSYINLDWINNFSKAKEIINNTDISIIDSYEADYEIYSKIKDLSKIAVYLDDNCRLNDYPDGVILNGAIFAYKLKYPERPVLKKYIGLKYMILRKEFWNSSKKRIRKKVKRILLTLGGTDIRNLSPSILKFLVKKYPKIKKEVFVTNNFNNLDLLNKIKDKNTKIHYLPSENKVKKIMEKTDIAISGGGQTLNELASLHVPTIAIVIIENQFNNIQEWYNLKCIEFAAFWNDKNLINKIEEKLEKMMNFKKRKRIYECLKTKVNGNGVNRFINDLLILYAKVNKNSSKN